MHPSKLQHLWLAGSILDDKTEYGEWDSESPTKVSRWSTKSLQINSMSMIDFCICVGIGEDDLTLVSFLWYYIKQAGRGQCWDI